LIIKKTTKQTHQKKRGDTFPDSYKNAGQLNSTPQSLFFGNKKEHIIDKSEESIYNDESKENASQQEEKRKKKKQTLALCTHFKLHPFSKEFLKLPHYRERGSYCNS